MAELYYATALYSYLKGKLKNIRPSELEKKLYELKPKWTAVVPVYNEEENIKECLDSIIGQTYPPSEIIILDDYSTDKTPKVIFDLLKEYKARQIEYSIINDSKHYFGSGQRKVIIKFYIPKLDIILYYVKNLEKNVGKSMNLNWAAFNLIKTQYFANIDGDTILEKDYAKKVLPLLLEENVAAAIGVAFPKTTKGNKFLRRILHKIKYFVYSKRGYILRRFWDVINFQYNLLGAATFYNTAIFKRIPRPLIGNSRDTLQAWLFQLNNFKIKYTNKAQVYVYSEGTFSYFIKERKRWGIGAFQAFYLLFRHLLKRRKYGGILVALLSYFIPIKYSLIVMFVPIYSLFTGNTMLYLSYIKMETLLFTTAAILPKLFDKNISLKDTLEGVIHMLLFGKYIYATTTLYNWIKSTYDYLTGRWKTSWRKHNT